MKNINKIQDGAAHWARRSCQLALVAAAAALLSGCYTSKLGFDIQREGSYAAAIPWWCQGNGVTTTDLTEQECSDFSWNLDLVLNKLNNNRPTVADLPPGAFQSPDTPANIGAAWVTSPTLPTTFNPTKPNVFMYDGTNSDSRLVGFGWVVDSASVPAGFAGDRDQWSGPDASGNYWLTVWAAQGYQNHPDIFASTHPCLNSTGAIAHDATSACYTSSHTEPLEVLVTNDDGVMAEGIDALVEALYLEPNVVVNVVAPKFNQSGSGAQVSPVSELSAELTTTLSGKPATAIASTNLSPPRNGSGSPADSVLWAIKQMYLTPDVALSGTNEGQNVGGFSGASGTVGAARAARNNGVPAIATSTGSEVGISAGPWDYETGVEETIKLFRDWRLGLRSNTVTTVESINIPSCPTGFSVRGVLETVLTVGGCIPSTIYPPPRTCDPGAPVVADGATDVQAFHYGYVNITDLGTTAPPSCP